MRHEFVSREGNQRLLIFFAGWGMDANVLRHIRRTGYDVMVVWDYTTFHIDWSCADGYSEICIFAWSMGVYAATLTTQALEQRITLSIAINGTIAPIHDHYGIPEDIFYGTLDGLSDRSVAKFFRRMCLDRDDYRHFQGHVPSRSTDSLREELESIADSLMLHAPARSRWDVAVISRDDRIFPFHNQIAAWGKEDVRIEVVAKGHYFDFGSLVDHHLIDKPLVSSRFKAGQATYRACAGVQADVVERMMGMARDAGIERYLMSCRNRVLEIGSGAGFLSSRIARLLNEARLEMWDIASGMPDNLPGGRKYAFRNCDGEMEIRRWRANSLDAVFSASTIQWFNSPAQFVAEMARAIVPGGYAAISTFAKGNLRQISELTGQSLPLPSAEEWAAIFSRNFTIIDTADFERDLDFETPVEVMRHLKMTGVNAVSGSVDPVVQARRIISGYRMMLDGRYHLTYHPIIFILQKK